MIHTVKGFSVVGETEVDVFLELSCFFYDPVAVGDLISGSSIFKIPGEGNDNPLQYSCLENPTHGEACRLQSMVSYSLWGRKESDMTEQLHFLFHFPLSFLNSA